MTSEELNELKYRRRYFDDLTVEETELLKAAEAKFEEQVREIGRRRQANSGLIPPMAESQNPAAFRKKLADVESER